MASNEQAVTSKYLTGDTYTFPSPFFFLKIVDVRFARFCRNDGLCGADRRLDGCEHRVPAAGAKFVRTDIGCVLVEKPRSTIVRTDLFFIFSIRRACSSHGNEDD